jgi:hypothetical protein
MQWHEGKAAEMLGISLKTSITVSGSRVGRQLLGNIAMAIYVLRELFRVPADGSPAFPPAPPFLELCHTHGWWLARDLLGGVIAECISHAK